ncbi:MAG: hypothetical protein JW885_03285 [Deltaproteobacteria bacterium]|nr:hypothetical protein [Candidatus Zymogenaceae bacterium]
MHRMSKPFYMISFLGVVIFPVVIGVIFRAFGIDIDEYRRQVMAAVLVYTTIIYLVFVWRIWTALQDGSARTTPLRAALFLIIPIFNIYWVFAAFPGFVDEYRAYAERNEFSVPRLEKGFFVVYGLLFALSMLTFIIPFLNIMVFMALYISLLIVVWQACDAVNALANDVGRKVPLSRN